MMKNVKIFFFLLTMMGSSAIISSCGNASNSPNDAAHGEGKAYTSAYVCPMHCDGSGGDAAGQCPVCGMDYVTQEEHVKDAHKH